MPASRPRRRRLSPLGVAAAIVGVALFAWTLHRTGLDPVYEGVRRVGLGFLVILAFAGVRFLLRGSAWALCAEGEPRLRFADTFPALVAGDALGNVTPLGLLASEPAKAAFVRHRVSLMSAASALTVENLFYTLTVALVIGGGTASLLFLFDVPRALQQVSLVALAAMIAIFAAGIVVLTSQIRVVARVVDAVDRRDRAEGAGAPGRAGAHARHPWRGRLARVLEFEERIYGFASRHPSRILPVLLLEIAFHVLAIAELWFTLQLLLGQAAPGLLITFVLEAVNRTITAVFKFVPLRLGVDEAGTELLTRTLGLDPGLGVTMAIIRKGRMLSWTAVGVAILVRRGLVARRAM
jgi:hypothetical protein